MTTTTVPTFLGEFRVTLADDGTAAVTVQHRGRTVHAPTSAWPRDVANAAYRILAHLSQTDGQMLQHPEYALSVAVNLAAGRCPDGCCGPGTDLPATDRTRAVSDAAVAIREAAALGVAA